MLRIMNVRIVSKWRLSRGMIGSQDGEPKVACPFHKKTFSLQTGKCLSDEGCYEISTYAVKVERRAGVRIFMNCDGNS